MTDLIQALVALIVGAVMAAAGLATEAKEPQKAEPAPVAVVAEPAPAAVSTPTVEKFVEDTLADDEARIAPFVNELGEVDTLVDDDQVGLVVMYCAPHVAKDPVLGAFYNCAEAVIAP